MNKFFLPLGLILIGIPGSSQSLATNSHNKSIAEYIKLEKSLGSEIAERKDRYWPGRGIAQPIIFKRKQVNLPDLSVAYYYYELDSTIAQVDYEWNLDGLEKILHPDDSVIRFLINKYNELHSEIRTRYGKSEREGEIGDISRLAAEGIKVQDLWRTNDSTAIDMYMTLSSQSFKSGAATMVPTYRIRVNIHNIRKENLAFPIKPDKARMEQLDSVVTGFLKDLEAKRFDGARLKLADELTKAVKDDFLETMRKNIRFAEKLVIYRTETHMDDKGAAYVVLQYKYRTDNENPPQELLAIVFNEQNQIAGLRASRRP